MSDYNSTARFLSNPSPPTRSPGSPPWSRRSVSASRSTYSQRPQNARQKIMSEIFALQTRAYNTYNDLTVLQRIGVILGGAVLFVLGILFLVYNERIFGALEPVAARWRAIPGGWLILWAATFFVSFPPLLGYSSCVTLAGFVFGVGPGWLIVASATILGSTTSFLVSRYFLQSYVQRMTESNKKFAALALTLKHDGIKLLVMIRLCPLPYSFSNGAISTIPTVKTMPFFIATAFATPKLFLHVFIGSRLAAIAEDGARMDFKTKAVSYVSIAIGACAGVGVGWWMYTKTAARAKELEAQERESAAHGARRSEDLERGLGIEEEEDGEDQYSDDPAERDAAQALIRGDDGMSLHTAADDDDADISRRGSRYTDYGDDDLDDARTLEDVFQTGDGDDDDEEENDQYKEDDNTKR